MPLAPSNARAAKKRKPPSRCRFHYRFPPERFPTCRSLTCGSTTCRSTNRPRSAPSLLLEAIRAEVAEIAGDVDAVFQFITERALSLTGASGAALAFLTPTSPADEKMICRAQAGDPAPPLGAPVDAKQGLSGECVRTGLLVSCEDMENDPRVDPEIGRALGIASLMAAPIVSDFRVR